MARRTLDDGNLTEFPTVRMAAARLRVGEKVLRAEIKRGEIPLYRLPGSWPRVHWPEVIARFRALRVRPTNAVAKRVDEAIRREDARNVS